MSVICLNFHICNVSDCFTYFNKAVMCNIFGSLVSMLIHRWKKKSAGLISPIKLSCLLILFVKTKAFCHFQWFRGWSVAEGSWWSLGSSLWLVYLVKESPSTKCMFCWRPSLTRLALGGPHWFCLLRKTVLHVPHKFLISRVSSKFSISPIAGIFSTFSYDPISLALCIMRSKKQTKYKQQEKTVFLPCAILPHT